MHSEVISISRNQRIKNVVRKANETLEKESISLSAKEVESLLYKLCVDLGYCLPPMENQRIISDPPKTPHRFTKAVMDAEGVGASDPDFYDPVHAKVVESFRLSRANDA